MKTYEQFLQHQPSEGFVAFIVYHHPCIDGAAAKYVANKAVRKNPSARVCLCRASYGATSPRDPRHLARPGDWVFLVDFSWPLNDLEALQARGAEVVVLDHHETAEAALKGFSGALFDMSKSGAVLTYEYFNPGVEEIPRLFQLVQDRDLWKWQYRETKDVSAVTALAGDDDLEWGRLEANDVWATVEEGRAITKARDKYLEQTLEEGTRVVNWFGFRAAIVNNTYMPSEVCHALCDPSGPTKADFACSWYISPAGKLKLSLRSDVSSQVKVNDLAKTFGGGGHPHAAGVNDAPLSLIKEVFYA